MVDTATGVAPTPGILISAPCCAAVLVNVVDDAVADDEADVTAFAAADDADDR